MADEPVTFLTTLRLIRSDFVRMAELMNMGKSPLRLIFLALTPSIVGLALYRISRWCYVRHMRFMAWPIWLLNLYLTGLDIVPTASIGRACFIGHPVGGVISGRIGDNAIMFGAPMIGGGAGHGDVGAGDGLPWIGDNVVMGIRCTILGPIIIGNRAQISACSLVMKGIPEGGAVATRPARPITTEGIDYEQIAGIKKKAPVEETTA